MIHFCMEHSHKSKSMTRDKIKTENIDQDILNVNMNSKEDLTKTHTLQENDNLITFRGRWH